MTTPATGPWRDSYEAAGIDAESMMRKSGTGYRVVHKRTDEGVRWSAIPIIPKRKRTC